MTKIIHEEIKISTNSKIELIDITTNIISKIRTNEISNGIVNISTKHTTTSIMINENEDGLLRDYKTILEKLVPEANYNHNMIDNNASSHLKAMLTTPNQTIPIIDGKISLGVWQTIFFVELDGPRSSRKVNITIIGE